MQIKISKKQWEEIGKKGGWFKKALPLPKATEFPLTNTIPKGLYGQGLNPNVMKLLKQYNIGPHELFEYDTANSNFPDIYEGIQKAKQGDLASLQMALKKRFGY